MKDDHGIPGFRELMWPVLVAVKGLGGSAHISEISEAVIEQEGFTEDQQQIRRSPENHDSMIDYQLAWARNYLKNIGALENSARGVWSITEDGRALKQFEIPELVKEWKREYYRQQKELDSEQVGNAEMEVPDGGQPEWPEKLLARLLEMPPDAFERLAQRLLREAGFRNVEVLGKSGDGGIDGMGVYRMSLVSFPTYFQCKRFTGSVSSGAVRDFRGAMTGRGEKGLIITTGSFTPSARDEATRDGAPPIDLVDGEELCGLLKEYRLGVEVTERIVQDVTVRPEFFDAI